MRMAGQESGNIVNTGTSASPAPTGQFIYKIAAFGGNAVIASAKDLNGAAITGFAGITVTDGYQNALVFPLSEVTLTSGKVIEYLGNLSLPEQNRQS
jgi:hypothetical protein